MSEKRGFVSVVVAVADAGRYVEDFVRECVGVLESHFRDHELILVDDASADDTVARVDGLLKGLPSLRLIRLARRFGPDVALTAGLDSAIGDYIVLMQAECDPPAEIPAMVRLAQSGCGIVTGVARHRPRERFWRRLLRSCFYHYCNRVLGLQYPRFATRFQVLGRPAATAATCIRPKCPQFPVLASQVGYESKTYRYRQVARPGPANHLGLRDKVDRGLSIMVLNSISPLRLVSYLGITAGLLNLAYACYVVVVNLLRKHVAEGWTTLSLQMTSMFFFIFLIQVVVCEYVGRILEETKDRPLYHVLEERNGSEVLVLQQQRNIFDKSA
jgi:glycosyltransferase involved in cell wall biosynthesis